MTATRKSVGDLLVEKKVITQEQLEEALEVAKATTSPVEQIIVDLGFAEERVVLGAKAQSLGVKAIDLSKHAIPDNVASLIPADQMEKHNVVPLKLDGRKLLVATADPENIMALDDLRMVTGYDVQFILASPSAIGQARAKIKPSGGGGAGGAAGGMNPFLGPGGGGGGDGGPSADDSVKSALQAMGGGAGDLGYDEEEEDDELPSEMERVKELVEEAPIIRIVNALFQQAIKDGASDIHVEPQRGGVRIRYRVDGVLHETMKVPKYVHAPLLSRIKIMSDMNIAERRIPQDGRIHLRFQKKDYDLRVSVCPTTYGEKAVMRILDKGSVMIGLERLGFLPDVQATLQQLADQPNGMLLTTGPTGSGKSTTMYSLLNVINTVEKNTITIEDPVEYQLPGLNQVHVNRKAGLTFANALKSFLRQDPDIIMVGEIRDLETAEIAVQASLTGHLVLSTLHTNDAPSTVTRMVDMGVEPFLISSSVIAVLAQRLCRRVCMECREPYEPSDAVMSTFDIEDPAADREQYTFYQGKGCDTCRFTGYKGRMVISELMVINEEIADLVVRRAPTSEVKRAAIANGMMTLQADGYIKACQGLTNMEELARVVITGAH